MRHALLILLLSASYAQASAVVRAKGPAWFTSAVAKSAAADPTFGANLTSSLGATLPKFSIGMTARAAISKLENAQSLLESRPETLTPAQASEVLAFYLLTSPETAYNILPALVALDARIVGEAAAFKPEAKLAKYKEWRRFVAKTEAALADPEAFFEGSGRWYGRTLVVDIGDGTVLAAKMRKDSEKPGELEEEAGKIAAVSFLGKALPKTQGEQRFHGGASGMIYTAPKEFFSYLNDKLPASMDAQAKASWIRTSALESIEQMAALYERGLIHESLAPISHSEARWRWNYFRWDDMRYGPSTIHSWTDALLYPNLRATGLADFAHVVSRDAADVSESHKGHGYEESKAITQLGGFADLQHTLIGQNLTEWALIVLHSAALNGVPMRQASDIVWDGFARYLTRLRGTDALAAIDAVATRRAILATGRLMKLWTWTGVEFIMPGTVIQPLIVRAVWPFTDAARGVKVSPIDYTAEPPVMGWVVLGFRKMVMIFIASAAVFGPLTGDLGLVLLAPVAFVAFRAYKAAKLWDKV